MGFVADIRKGEAIMDKRINFTQEELQLIHVACMMYGNELLDISKKYSPTEGMSESLRGRAEEFCNLGKKIKAHMEGVYGTDNKAND